MISNLPTDPTDFRPGSGPESYANFFKGACVRACARVCVRACAWAARGRACVLAAADDADIARGTSTPSRGC